ncbi:hypothetical protein H2203_000758 [Taxawa tesnikishii (nom. ined.)]|nr:hypothetical protein H2203_000758 [Dothideales sp. JES 119]
MSGTANGSANPGLRTRNKTATEQAIDGAEAIKDEVKQDAKRLLTVLWSELPSWQQDNHYITSGYRPESNSYRLSASSLSYLHNETVNIYTHLIGAVIALIGSGVLYHSLRARYEHATREDVYVFSCFFLGAVACLDREPARLRRYCCLDLGSFIPSIYYGFSAERGLINIYWIMITVIGAGCTIVTISPRFRTPEWRAFRASMFVAMGLSAIVPVLHGIRLYGIAQLERQIGLSWLVLQGVLYILGAAIYA